MFPQALRNVAEARGGMSKTAAASKLNRESLYRMLSRAVESKDAGVGGALKEDLMKLY